MEGDSESELGKRGPPDLFHRWSKGEGDLLAQGTGHLPRVREVRLKEVVCYEGLRWHTPPTPTIPGPQMGSHQSGVAHGWAAR